MAGGRPLKFKDPVELEKKIEEYFKWCDGRTKEIIVNTKEGPKVEVVSFPRPYTVEGLAVYLETTTHTLMNYLEKDEFFTLITHAKERIRANKVEGGLDRTYDSGMAKFMLACNYGYSDKSDDDDKEITVNIVRKTKPRYKKNGEGD